VDVDSPWISGRFQGALLARTGEDPRVRLQLFHDVGTKVLDLVARTDRVVGVLPDDGLADDRTLPPSGRPTALFCLGLTLLQQFAGVEADRLVGARDGSDGRELRIEPVVRGLTVILVAGDGARFREFRFELPGGVRWHRILGPGAASTIEGPDVRVTLTPIASNIVQSVPASVFDLAVPEGMSPLQP